MPFTVRGSPELWIPKCVKVDSLGPILYLGNLYLVLFDPLEQILYRIHIWTLTQPIRNVFGHINDHTSLTSMHVCRGTLSLTSNQSFLCKT